MAEQHAGVYAGTFDPITNGHMDIITRAARHLVDRLILAVARNPGKGTLFSLEERVQMVQAEVDATDYADRIEVQPFEGLLTEFAESNGANVLIRGLRAVSDFEYEFQMASMNHYLKPNIETTFLMASDRNQFISSSLVKEICLLNGDVAQFVSPRVAEKLIARR